MNEQIVYYVVYTPDGIRISTDRLPVESDMPIHHHAFNEVQYRIAMVWQSTTHIELYPGEIDLILNIVHAYHRMRGYVRFKDAQTHE